MDEHVDVMLIALRILVALAEGRQPLPEDAEELLRQAPEGKYASLDELACRVVEEALKRLREKRQAGGA